MHRPDRDRYLLFTCSSLAGYEMAVARVNDPDFAKAQSGQSLRKISWDDGETEASKMHKVYVYAQPW
jgi:hypothetical protein